MDTYTTVSKNSYGSRIGNALKGIIFGPILILLAIVLLWWNEGRAVERTRDLSAGEKIVISLESPESVYENEGKLIHTNGILTSGMISDPQFGIQTQGSILARKVEMYQWDEKKHEEKKDNLGGSETVTTTYTYDTIWSEDTINSENFEQSAGHQNPNTLEYRKQEFVYDDLKLGDFSLSNSLTSALPTPEKLDISTLTPTQSGFTSTGSYFYKGTDIAHPQVGDIRISYSFLAPETQVSVLAQQEGTKLTAYHGKNTDIERIMIGSYNASEMFDVLRQENTITTWLLRLAGFVCMLIGWSAFLSIIPTLAAIVPFFKTLLGFGTGIIALVLSILLSSLIIVIAWIFVRPFLAIGILLAAIGIVFAIFKMKAQKTLAIPPSPEEK